MSALRRLAFTLLGITAPLLVGCGRDEGGDHVDCEAPGGCSTVLSTLATGEMVAELIPDGRGGAYAAFQGSGLFPSCNAQVICHGELWRIDPDGDVDWKQKEGKSVSRPFLVPGGVAYRTGGGTLVMVGESGKERWRFPTGDPLLTASVVFDSVLVAGGGALSRLSLDHGDILWTVPLPEIRPIAPAGTSDGWALTLGVTVDTAGSLTARAFDYRDGEPGWTVELPAQLSAPGLFGGSEAGGLTPTLLVSDRLSMRGWYGDEVWGVSGEEGFRFVSRSSAGGFFASGPYLDMVTEYRDDGTVAWARTESAPVTWVSPTPDGHVLVGHNDGVVKKIKGEAGTVLWDYGSIDDAKPQSPPLHRTDGTAVFWGANLLDDPDTHLTTVTAFGQGLDRWDAGARIVSGALSDDGDVFLATADGLLYLRRAAEF